MTLLTVLPPVAELSSSSRRASLSLAVRFGSRVCLFVLAAFLSCSMALSFRFMPARKNGGETLSIARPLADKCDSHHRNTESAGTSASTIILFSERKEIQHVPNPQSGRSRRGFDQLIGAKKEKFRVPWIVGNRHNVDLIPVTCGERITADIKRVKSATAWRAPNCALPEATAAARFSTPMIHAAGWKWMRAPHYRFEGLLRKFA